MPRAAGGKAGGVECRNARLSAEERKKQLGVWAIRSTDSGLTWSPPIGTVVNSPHGPISSDAGCSMPADQAIRWDAGRVAKVADDERLGAIWRTLHRATATSTQYHELHRRNE
jgi:hypothetical protein